MKKYIWITLMIFGFCLPTPSYAQQQQPAYSQSTDPWLNGTKGIKYMVDHAAINIKNRDTVDNFVANKLNSKWKKSTIRNEYAPFREMLVAKFEESKALNTIDHNRFKNILYRSSKKLDKYYEGKYGKDNMPDYLYDWLEVKETASKSISIVIKTLTGTKIDITIEKSSTVLGLKEAVLEKEGIPPAQQRLVFNGTQLEDARTLSDYNIVADSTLYLILRLRQ